MELDQIDEVLSQTLAGGHISGAEKRALVRMLGEAEGNRPLLNQIRGRAFDLARERFADSETRATLNWLEDLIKVVYGEPLLPQFGATRVFFSPGSECRNEITAEMKRCTDSLDICVFTITDDALSGQILATHHRGIKVRIITDDRKQGDKGSDIDCFEAQGIEVKTDQSRFHMHHKFAIFDQATVLTGSFNWTRTAVEVNHENLVFLQDPHAVRAYRDHFEGLWRTMS